MCIITSTGVVSVPSTFHENYPPRSKRRDSTNFYGCNSDETTPFANIQYDEKTRPNLTNPCLRNDTPDRRVVKIKCTL